jgi:putative Holliday junction resolvase
MKVIGIDYGEKRIGIATADTEIGIASPWRVYEIKNKLDVVSVVTNVIKETGANLVIVGLPLNMNGTYGAMAKKVEQFVEELRKVCNVDIKTWDERLTSMEADRALSEMSQSRKQQRKVQDKLAAQLILQNYLDCVRNAQTTP